jgi:maleylacetate reductase
MPHPFTLVQLPARVRFDAPAAATVAEETSRLALSRVLLVAMPGPRAQGQSLPISLALGAACAAVFDDARPHVPAETLADCLAVHTRVRADGLVAVGGGSAIGLAKLVAARTGTPLVAVPTTYSGAEMTPFNAVTEGGVKTQHRDLRMLPAAVVYDPDLTVSLPLAVTGPSMMNAVAHAVEAMYAPETNPVVEMAAAWAIGIAARALPQVAADPADRAARRDLLLAAMLAGQALAVTSMGLHHKLCHILGGTYDLPHAGVNAVVLPYAMAYNGPGAPHTAAQVAARLGAADAAAGLFDLARGTGAPASLAALGLPEAALDDVARTAAAQRYANPVPLAEAALRRLLDDAWHGRRPTLGAYG